MGLFGFRGGNRRDNMTIERPSGIGRTSRWSQTNTRSVPRRLAVRVDAIERETRDTVSWQLLPLDSEWPTYQAGQYFTHCFTIDGRPCRRAYSLSAAEQAGLLRFTCKRVEDGVVSSYLHQRLQVGDSYELLGPSGDFQLPNSGSEPLVYVAAGSGITPVISLIETMVNRDPGRPQYLLYSSRSLEGLIFKQRLTALASRFPSLRLEFVITQADSTWSGLSGRLDGERVWQLAGQNRDTRYFLCGPGEFMDSIEQGLHAHGLDPNQIHRESFLSATHHSAERQSAPQSISLRRSDATVVQQPGQSILEALLGAGIQHEFSCTVGGCGACRVQVLDGPVAIVEPNCLTPGEREAGFTLACSAYATGPIEVDA